MIDKEKQIENIAIDLNNIVCFKDNGLVARYATAEAMYNAGYRKAYEVAREIFAEIERLLDNHHSACLPVGAIEAYTYYEGGSWRCYCRTQKEIYGGREQ